MATRKRWQSGGRSCLHYTLDGSSAIAGCAHINTARLGASMIVLAAFLDAYPYLADGPWADYRATYHILYNCFANDCRVWSHVMPGIGIDFARILEQDFSSGERCLLQLAQMIWSGRTEYNIIGVLAPLDHRNLQVAIEAIELRLATRFDWYCE